MGQADLIRRLPDWEARLIAYIQQELGKPYDLGATDCHTLLAGVMDAMCGTWPDPGHRYTTLREVQTIVKTYNPMDWVERWFCTERVNVNFQQRGDLIFMDAHGVACSHIVLGEEIVSVDPQKGVTKGRPADLTAVELLGIIRIL
jgi:hypothetical protein